MADQNKADQLTGRASIQAGTYINGELQQTPAQKAAAGPQPEGKTVQMDILRDGSFGGVYHHAGDTADVPEQHVETLTLSGFAARTDRAAVAQQARDEMARDQAAESKTGEKASTAVAPMSTTDPTSAKTKRER